MPEIPTLTEILGTHSLRYEGSILGFGCNCGILLAASDAPEADRDRAYAEHVAGMYREARTIRKRQNLRSLLIGTTIIDREGDAGTVASEVPANRWSFTASEREYSDQYVALPALVLHTPRDEAKP